MRVLLAAALVLTLAPPSGLAGEIHRSEAAVHHFMLAHPCPGGQDMGSTHRCRGWVVDHKRPLCDHGRDEPRNMQWQTAEDGRAKDHCERVKCHLEYPRPGIVCPWRRSR